MSILLAIIVSFLAWVSIIVVSAISTKCYNKDLVKYGEGSFEVWHYKTSQKEMLKDGNNLFSTALIYIVALVTCYFVKIKLVSYIIMAGMFLFALPSLFQMIVTMIPQIFQYKNKYITFMTITALINVALQLIIAGDVYFLTIK